MTFACCYNPHCNKLYNCNKMNKNETKGVILFLHKMVNTDGFSMNLRKRQSAESCFVCSMVVMCAIADAASTVSAEGSKAVVADTRTDLATDGTAGVVAQLNQINTDIVEMAAAGIENSQTILVASADEEAQAVEDTDTLKMHL